LKRLKWLSGEEFSPAVEETLTISEPEKEAAPAPIGVEKVSPSERLRRFVKLFEKLEELDR